MKEQLLMVGCGKMGGALLSGYLKSDIPASNIRVIEPHVEHFDKQFSAQGVQAHSGIDALPADYAFDIIQLAVKPQVMADVLPDYKARCRKDTLFISIAAGKTLDFFAKHLGEQQPVIRVMPNLPALVGKGASALYANAHVTAEQKALAEKLFSSVGKTFWLENEAQMDAVTAVSGSGPAYVFHFLESLEQGAKSLGLPDDLAKALAYSTLSGSAELALTSDKSAADLREQVTSPNGTTEAGLKVLMKDLPKLMECTVEAACKRSKELAD